jgi:hypothetical protein
MSAGLGHVQRDIIYELREATREGAPGVRFAELRARMPAAQNERSLWRALRRLIDRGDVVIAGGIGRSRDPWRYAPTDMHDDLHKFFAGL